MDVAADGVGHESRRARCPAAQRARIAVDETSGVGVIHQENVRPAVVPDPGCLASAAVDACGRRATASAAFTLEAVPSRPAHHHELGVVQEGGIVAPGRNFRKRVGAGDEEQLRRPIVRAREVRAASRTCRTVRRPRVRGPTRAGRPGRPRRAPPCAKRCAIDASGWGRWGGTWDGSSRTWSRSSASRAAAAADRCPRWTGSNVPPSSPMRLALCHSRGVRIAGAAASPPASARPAAT